MSIRGAVTPGWSAILAGALRIVSPYQTIFTGRILQSPRCEPLLPSLRGITQRGFRRGETSVVSSQTRDGNLSSQRVVCRPITRAGVTLSSAGRPACSRAGVNLANAGRPARAIPMTSVSGDPVRPAFKGDTAIDRTWSKASVESLKGRGKGGRKKGKKRTRRIPGPPWRGVTLSDTGPVLRGPESRPAEWDGQIPPTDLDCAGPVFDHAFRPRRWL